MTPNDVLDGTALWCVLEGDCITLDIPAESIDAVVSDPPAGIGFMGKDWDHHKGGRDAWIAWMAERMRVAFRLLKPGGHALIWALPRTSHWTATAIEDAGFEVRDVLTHHFGSGFPKSLDVSKAIDSAAGAVREVVGLGAAQCHFLERGEPCAGHGQENAQSSQTIHRLATAPATPEAAQWQGWGTALKPASEHWILARKPLIGTVAANVHAHGTGAINVDACRVGTSKDVPASVSRSRGSSFAGSVDGSLRNQDGSEGGFNPAIGRWPTNLLLSHGECCREVGTRQAIRKVETGVQGNATGRLAIGDGIGGRSTTGVAETVPAWDCAPDCPVAELDRQSGTLTSGAFDGVRNGTETRTAYGTFLGNQGAPRHANSGGASRFYPTFRYVPKAPRAMREAGLVAAENERANDHPTVKHDDLIRWLARLITPPGGVVLDMFCGSGSTGRGALMEGFRFIGIDIDAHYVQIAEARIKAAEPKPDRQLTLFEGLK